MNKEEEENERGYAISGGFIGKWKMFWGDDCNDGALYRICFNNFSLTSRKFFDNKWVFRNIHTLYSVGGEWEEKIENLSWGIFTEIAFAIIMAKEMYEKFLIA